ncbi:MAG: hypothetical protein VXA26_10345, partial [Candidatus Neomarinimicrobiota bacterium]
MSNLKNLIIIVPLLLISCGGGGGGGSDSSIPQGSGGTPQPTNTAPTINNSTNSFTVVENQTSAFSVEVSDAEGDALSFTISGVDGTLFSVTSSGVVSFISAPDFEAPQDNGAGNVYNLTVTVSDGSLSSNADFIVNVSNDTSDDIDDTPVLTGAVGISGNVIDGYVSGATVFIDENFNLTFDEGELYAETDDNGAYELKGANQRFIQLGYVEAIEDSEEVNLLVEQELLDAYYACWRDRPIVADVPEGANDSSTGLVREPYQMVLPASISRFVYGDDVLNITPFTNFLVDAVQTVIVENEVELTLEQGCSDEGDAVQELVTDEVNALLADFQDAYGFTFEDLVSNFMEQIRNDKITEENAQIIASWLPKFLAIKTQVGEEMSTTFEKSVYPQFNIDDSSKDALINGTDPEEVAVGFNSFFEGPENENGWYYTHYITSWGSKLNKTGDLIPFKCADGTPSCNINSYSLDDYYNASAYWMNRITFKNNSSIPGHEDKTVSMNTEDENRWELQGQGGAESVFSSQYNDFESFNENVDQVTYEAMTRSCIKLDELEVAWEDGVLPYDIDLRYNFGYNNREVAALDCRALDEVPPLHIFFLVYPDYDSAQIQIQDPDFLENLVVKPFENRETLNPIPLLDEIDEMPKYFADFAE